MNAIMLKHGVVIAGLTACTSVFADVSDTRTFTDTISIDDVEAVSVEVENVIGPVRVTGHDRATVEYTVIETIRADTQSDLDRAREEVELRVDQDGGRIELEVRMNGDDCDCRWMNWDDYVVEYEFELRVPRSATLDLSTVDDGEILIEGVAGEFEASHVNGPVRLRDVSGPGSVRTVNGRIDAVFDDSPDGELSFKTVNGRIDVAFPSDLSADLEFKSLNGDFWTDFDVTHLGSATERTRRDRDGLFVVRTDSRVRVRAGDGGPTYSFETLNSDIHVREAR